jgi:hypothetical protein
MTEPRFTFRDVSIRMRSTFRFYDDRIEQEWDTLSRKGTSVHPVAAISGRYSEQTTFAYGFRQPFRMAVIQLIVGLVLNFGFDRPLLHSIGYFFYVLSGVGALVAIFTLKKDNWIYVLDGGGRTLICVREKGMKGATKEDLVREIQRYVSSANQAPLRTPGSVTPAANAPVAPPPGAAGL